MLWSLDCLLFSTLFLIQPFCKIPISLYPRNFIFFGNQQYALEEKAMAPHSSTLAWKLPWTEEPGRLQFMGSQRVGHDFTFTFHFHALEKEMATHSSVLAWRIPGTAEPHGLPSVGSHRVRHDWSDLAAAGNSKPIISVLSRIWNQGHHHISLLLLSHFSRVRLSATPETAAH